MNNKIIRILQKITPFQVIIIAVILLEIYYYATEGMHMWFFMSIAFIVTVFILDFAIKIFCVVNYKKVVLVELIIVALVFILLLIQNLI